MKKVLKKIQQVFDIKKPRKIIDTLFASYVVIIIIPIVILGILFTSLFSYYLSEQTKNNAQYTITYAGKFLEEQLTSVHNTAYNLMIDQNILSLEKQDKYSIEQMMAVSRARSALQRIHAQNENIDDIYLVYIQKGLAIAANQSNASEKQLLSLFDMESKEFYNYLSSNNGSFVAVDTLSVQGEKKRNILYIKAVDKKRVSGDIYSIFFLNDRVIKDTMNTVNADRNTASVLLLDEKYNCLLCDNDEFVYSKNDRENIIAAHNEGSEYKTVWINGRASYVIEENIALTKLKLFMIVDKYHYISVLWPVWILIVIVSLFIMLISVFAAKLFTRRVYRPIGNIINMFKPDNSEYGEKSEIAFIDSKFLEIQDMKDKLSEHEATHTHNMRRMLLANFLKGYIGDAESFKESMANFGVCFDAKRFVIALLKVDRLSEIAKKIQVYHYQKFLMNNICETLIAIYPQIKERIYEFYDGEYIGILIGYDDSIDIRKGVASLQETLTKKHDITVSVCISDETERIEALVDEYKTVAGMMKQIKLKPYGYSITACEYRQHKSTVDIEQFSKKLYLCIVNQKYDELNNVINSVFNHGDMFYTEIIRVYTETLKVIQSVGNAKNCSDSLIGESSAYSYDKLNEFTSFEDFYRYMKKICTDAAHTVASVSQSTNKAYEKILEYIETNYMNEIGLEDMAQAFSYSKNYFSRYFKELTGKNFVEMLNGYRIEKAKELVKNDSNIKLLTVAKAVGFTNYRTFSAAFRKFEGQSPEDYRRNI